MGAASANAAISAPSFVTIMPLGDSITVGYNNVDEEGGYRSYLYNDLITNGVGVQFQGIVSDNTNAQLTAANENYYTAQSGYDSTAIYNNLAGSAGALHTSNTNYGGYWMTGGNGTGRGALNPNIVLLLCGANDWSGAGETESAMQNMLNWFAVNRPGTEVIVGSTPPEWGYSDVYTNDSRTVNAWLQQVVPTLYPQDRAVDIVDQFLNPDGSVNTSLMPEYSVHPDQAGYQVIANVFDQAILSSIQVPEPGTLMLVPATGLLMRRKNRGLRHPHE